MEGSNILILEIGSTTIESGETTSGYADESTSG